MLMRFLALVMLLIIASGCKRDDVLSQTLAWMDNTYNPHDGVSGAFGHGRTGWYAPDKSLGSAAAEYLVSGSTETFTHDRCQIALRIDDNRSASAHREIYGSTLYTFSLHDINPQSIKVSTYS